MSLFLPYDPTGVPPQVTEQMNTLIAALQTWAGKVDGAGKWIDVPYDSSFYRSTAGTWTVAPGNQRSFRYAINQDVMSLRVALLETSTDANVTSELRILIPGGFRATDKYFMGVAQWNAGVAGVDGVARVFGRATPDDNYIGIVRDVLAVSTNWPINEVNSLNVQLNIVIPVYRDPNS